MSPREKAILAIMQGLTRQKESLLKDAAETLNTLPGELNFPDMGDQATAETDRNFMLRLRDRERGLLKKIDQAIDRIKSKTYGLCEACGSEIGIKRLQARPVTTLCVDCKMEQEEEERISRGR
ncbi:MAG: RNA polymerase-binding protein DksA [Nitrospirae bacterium]|nr:RNA polymerase-binding protein DksA [Nitrospirota bacterium]